MGSRRWLLLRVANLVIAVLSIFHFSLFQTSQISSAGLPTVGLSPGLNRMPNRKALVVTQEMPGLSGEKAIDYLKQEGTYDSLGEAMAAARYGVNWVNNPRLKRLNGAYEAHNPAQGFTSYFTPEGVHLIDEDSDNPEWFLEMKLQEVGYGDQLGEVSSGTPTVTTNRVELVRNASFKEWFVNDPQGLEHGMVIAERPVGDQGEGNLRVVFDLEGSLTAQGVDNSQAIEFLDLDGDQVLRYDRLKVNDATGQEVSGQLKVESGSVVWEIDDREAVYPVTIDPTISRQATLTASDGATGDNFGTSVAISGETVVVGVPLDNVGSNSNQGSVYVFARSGMTWSQQAKLVALAPVAGGTGNEFGTSVGISGETVVVGAPHRPNGIFQDEGAVYVFVRSGTTWAQQAFLTASDGFAHDQFGTSVAIDGETIIVGVPLKDEGSLVDQGSAYAFVRTGTAWAQQAKFIATDPGPGDQFGASVAISGEIAIVGAPFNDIGSNTGQGSAYVFTRVGTSWGKLRLTASDGGLNDHFGSSVGISGHTVVIGARHDGGEVGSAYVFRVINSAWVEEAKLLASDGISEDQFGSSIGISGETVVVGAIPGSGTVSIKNGSAYVFARTGTTWTQQQKLTASGGSPGDQFGTSVAISGETMVVGAPLDDIGANTDRGSAHVFTCTSTTRGWVEQAKTTASDGGTNDQFGASVAINGEVAIVGAPFDDIGSDADQGSVYLFQRTGTTWTQQQKLIAAVDGAAEDQFGTSVAINGNILAIGAPSDDTGADTDQGSVYIFETQGAGWLQRAKLLPSDGAAGDSFGASVAVAGQTVVVGAIAGPGTAGANRGAAYVFLRTGTAGTNWAQQAKLTASDGANLDNFGSSVAIDGETIVVGALADTVGANNDQGSAYVFQRRGTTWTQERKLTASDGESDDRFGCSVAIDGETVVVGTRQTSSPDPGAAYVFVRAGTTWTQQQILTASDGGNDDRFGSSVGISGERIVIGAPFDDIDANSNRGSAYLFVRAGATWTQHRKLTASDGTTGDLFGTSVAINGETIVVGAKLDDITQADRGSAYMYILDCFTCPTITRTISGAATICAGDSTPITVTVSGGVPPYTVTLNNGGGTQTGSSPLSFSVSPGSTTTYSVQSGTDSVGCPITGSGNATITVRQPPTTAAVGGAQTICASGTTTGLGGNSPTVGTGQWSIVSGGTGIFSPNATTPNATFTHSAGAGPVLARWTISNSPCTASSATVMITVRQPPTTATVGGGQSICTNGTTTGLGGNTPTNGTGTWSVVSGGTGTFNPNATTPNATFTHTGGAGPITVRWTITNSPCTQNSIANVTITLTQGPTPATVGGAQTICVNGTTTGLGGNSPAVGTGQWSIDSGGTGTFNPNAATPNATFTHTGGTGPVVVRWTISSGSCIPSSATVPITLRQPPTTATVGGAQTLCGGGATTGLGGNTPTNGTGTWSVVSGGAGTFNPNNTTPNATFTHSTGVGPVTLRWTISNSPCTPNSTADVTITLTQGPTPATVGGAQTICMNGTTTGLGGNSPAVGTGQWSIDSGGTGTFNPNATTPNATFTHTGGTGPVVVRWTISSGSCTSSSATVMITLRQPPTTATVGGAQTICGGSTTTGLGGNTPTNGTGTWSVVGGGTGTFNPNATTPNATFTHSTGAGPVTLRWTISNSPCTPNSTADVTITITPSATTATVGGAQTICVNGTTSGLGGNTPTVGIGNWSVDSGGTGTFNPNATTPNATFTHTSGTGTVTVRWTISNGTCPNFSATVVISINPPPTTATVGGAQTICGGSTTTGLGGNTPTTGTGSWSVVGGGTGTFSPSSATPNATFTHTGGTGPVMVQWTISNGICPDSMAMAMVFITQPSMATAGGAQVICAGTTTTGLGGNTPVVGTGTWSVVSGGTGTFNPNTTTPNATFTHTGGTGPMTVRWTVTNPPCPDSTADVVITINPAPTVNAGPDQAICGETPVVTLAAILGGVATTGTWTGGAGSFTPDNTAPNATYTPTAGEIVAGTVTLTFTTDTAGGSCPAASDEVTITFALCIGLMVADTANNRIQVFDGANWSVIGVGTVGSGDGQFRLPEAVTFDGGGRIYVADTGNNRVQFSTDAGTTWADLATNGTGLNQVNAPQGVALDSAGNLYVSDTGNGRVMRFNGGIPGNGVVIASNGTASGQVGSPRGLAIDATFRLFVTDESNSRILRISDANTIVSGTSGTILATAGTALNRVQNPQGIAIDGNGTLFVADTGNSRILRWINANPNSATTMALIGSGLGQVNHPEGVTVTQFTTGALTGGPLLVVGDTSNNRIQGRFLPTGSWTLIGTPNGIGTGIGQFRAPSKIR